MPNWCSNFIVFSGDKDRIQKLKSDLTQPVFSISEGTGWLGKVDLEPPPWGMYWTEKERLENSVVDPHCNVCSRTLTGLGLDFNSIGYHEMIDSVIGTKWDFNLDVHSEEDGRLVYNFSSAWSPPLIWVARVALKYKIQADIEFEEGGCDFAGKLKANGLTGKGILIESNYSQYRLADIGDMEEWIEVDIEDICDAIEEVQKWRDKAKDWPTTMEEYDVKYLTGEFELRGQVIPGR